MRITVQANHPHHSQLARAQRFWPTKEALEVEVIDSEDDPPPVKVKVKNSTTGQMVDQERPNPTKIGRRTLAILRADHRLSIQQLDSINSRAADAAVGAAQAEVSRLAAELTDEKSKRAGVEAQLAEATTRIGELEAEIAKLKAAPVAEDGEQGPHGDEGKGGKAKGSSKK